MSATTTASTSNGAQEQEEVVKMTKIWIKNLKYPRAAQPEIIRADQKDEYLVDILQDRIEPLLRAIKGARWVNTHSDKLQECSKLIYLLMTTLSGSQTLGEEYCDIVQFDRSNNDLPALHRRAILIFAQVFSRRLFIKLYNHLRLYLTKLKDQYHSSEHERNQNREPSPGSQIDSFKEKFFSLLGCFPVNLDRSVFHSLHTLHLAIFYLTGRYFSWSKRFSRITYISNRLRPLRQDGLGRESPPSYEVLGVLIIIQLIIKTVGAHQQAKRRRQQLLLASEPAMSSHEETSESLKRLKQIPIVDGRLIDEIMIEPDPDDDQDTDEVPQENGQEEENMIGQPPEGVLIDQVSDEVTSRRCTLCLGPRKDQTSLECGHLFCWKCVVSWVKEKPECPLCRHSVRIADLLPLYNF